MTHFQAIIFDMDGLLVDSEPIWEQAEISVLAAHGKTLDPKKREHLVGLRMDEFIPAFIRLFEVDAPAAAVEAEIVNTMLGFIATQVVTRPGAPELLAYIQQNDIPCAIASSSPAVIIDAVVESQGWGEVFPIRVSAEVVAKGKPAPDVYLEAARQIGAIPGRTLALEDSPNGARSAVAAGMTCYAVPDLSHTRVEAFADITPYVYDSLHTVLAALLKV